MDNTDVIMLSTSIISRVLSNSNFGHRLPAICTSSQKETNDSGYHIGERSFKYRGTSVSAETWIHFKPIIMSVEKTLPLNGWSGFSGGAFDIWSVC